MSLAAVRRFVVPARVVSTTEEALRDAGNEGYELFVLWTGVIERDVFHVRTTHLPHQQSYRLADGLCVRVDGQALHELNVWQFEHGEALGVQVHSHPHDAYHSQTDDTFPIVTQAGGLSLVAPDFCRRGLLTPGCAAYRLSASGWSSVDPRVVEVM